MTCQCLSTTRTIYHLHNTAFLPTTPQQHPPPSEVTESHFLSSQSMKKLSIKGASWVHLGGWIWRATEASYGTAVGGREGQRSGENRLVGEATSSTVQREVFQGFCLNFQRRVWHSCLCWRCRSVQRNWRWAQILSYKAQHSGLATHIWSQGGLAWMQN